MSKLIAFALLFGLLPADIVAQEHPEMKELTANDRFSLWNDCMPMTLDVRYEVTKTPKFNLGEIQAGIIVRSRLRAARLYSITTQPAHLQLAFQVLSGSVAVRFDFNKYLYDPVSGTWGRGTTWIDGFYGIAGSDTVTSQLSVLTDRFIDEYLRVNHSACLLKRETP